MTTTTAATTDTFHVDTLSSAISVFFGAVGLTSLFLAFFAVWLSWQFYKESRQQSDRVSDAVNRIESIVSAVRVNIEQVVEKTIDNLLNSQNGYSDENLNETLRGLDDLRAKVSELEEGHPHADDRVVSELRTMIMAQEKKIEDFARTHRETHIRTIFGSSAPKAVSSEVTIQNQSENYEKGIVTLKVNRPLLIATGTGKFSTQFTTTPHLKVELTEYPGSAEKLILNSGVGSGSKLNEFNVHLNAALGEKIEPGIYIVSYEARVLSD